MSYTDWQYQVVDTYRGYEICAFRLRWTGYYFIGRDGERISQLCFGSPKGCKNIIDTHLRNEVKPVYR